MADQNPTRPRVPMDRIRAELAGVGSVIGGGPPDVDDVMNEVETLRDAILRLCDLVEDIGSRTAAPPTLHLDFDDVETFGSALERGLDSTARDIKDAIEAGLSECARAIEKIEVEVGR